MSYFYPAYSSQSPTGAAAATTTATATTTAAAPSSVSSMSRPTSVSPQFGNAYTFYSATRLRFQASRGFEVEDDMEFCPALVQEPSRDHYEYDDQSSTTSSLNEHLHTPETSPTFGHSTLAESMSSTPSPLNSRTRKAIEIVDPTTGMKVSSPVSRAK